MALGKWQLVVILMICLPFLLGKIGCLKSRAADSLWGCSVSIAGFSSIIWRFLELLLYYYVINDSCDGIIYLYGLLLVIINVFVFVKKCFGRNE